MSLKDRIKGKIEDIKDVWTDLREDEEYRKLAKKYFLEGVLQGVIQGVVYVGTVYVIGKMANRNEEEA